MDVQVIDASAAPQGAVAQPAPVVPSAPAAVGVPQTLSVSPTPGDPAASPTPATGSPASPSTGGSLPAGIAQHSTLLSSVARALAGAAVSVSYRVDVQDGEVVTVFTDEKTGQKLFQVPSQVLEQLATFFDQQSGTVVDQKV